MADVFSVADNSCQQLLYFIPHFFTMMTEDMATFPALVMAWLYLNSVVFSIQEIKNIK